MTTSHILTEDDTFRMLKRLPYEEMRQRIIKISLLNLPDPQSRKVKTAALEANGWTFEEYRDQRVKDAQRHWITSATN